MDLLPDDMLTRLLTDARRNVDRFADYASRPLDALATGGEIDCQAAARFNGGLFDNNRLLPLDREGIEAALKAASLVPVKVYP
ncbi:MAG: hypothetical protein OXF74_00050 [Rhodobacteraceae bacterium]|nr:hypothetical protein [Paracoccaceae bacterium]